MESIRSIKVSSVMVLSMEKESKWNNQELYIKENGMMAKSMDSEG